MTEKNAGNENRHGLSRHIPTEVKRLVRRNSGFSCVICENPFCQYEHITPEFKDAKEHAADDICLLCPTCHAEVTAKRYSKEFIRSNYKERCESKSHVSKKKNLFYFTTAPKIRIGDCVFQNMDTVICTDKINCLSFNKDTEHIDFWTISANFFDVKGSLVLAIEDNCWESIYGAWDVVIIGQKVSFLSGPSKNALSFEVDPKACLVTIKALDMRIGEFRVALERDRLRVERVGSFGKFLSILVGVQFSGGKAGIFLDGRHPFPDFISNIPILHHNFCGITIGRQAHAVLQYYEISKLLGVSNREREKPAPIKNPEAYVKGQLMERTVHFPFWTEIEFYLNGVQVSHRPPSVDDAGVCEFGAPIEIFHLGPTDADKFTRETGLIGNCVGDLDRPPTRPNTYL